MNTGIVLLLTLIMSVMLFIVQRIEARKRLFFAIVMLVGAELIRRYVWFNGVHSEAWTAFVAALVLNLLFWLLIGRYNPVGSSERIRVIGMDD